MERERVVAEFLARGGDGLRIAVITPVSDKKKKKETTAKLEVESFGKISKAQLCS